MMKSFEESVKGILSGYEAEVPAGLFEKISESLEQPAQSSSPEPVSEASKSVNPYTPAISGVVVATAGFLVAGIIAGNGANKAVEEPMEPATEMITEEPSQQKDAETYYMEEDKASEAVSGEAEIQQSNSVEGKEQVEPTSAEEIAQANEPTPEAEEENTEETEPVTEDFAVDSENQEEPASEQIAESTEPENREAKSSGETGSKVDISEIAKIQARPLRGGVPLEVNLSAPRGAKEYEWTIDERLVRNGREVSHTFDETGRHSVRLKVTDEDGRSSEDEEVVEAVEGSTLFIPNSFTPNGDNVNDIFRAEGAKIGRFQMEVFNIKGEKIFTTNDPARGWDGEDNISEQQNRDTYFVVIKARGTDGRDLSTQKMINVFR